LLTFAAGNQIQLAQLRQAVRLDQLPGKNPEKQLLSYAGDALDLELRDGDELQSAETFGSAQIVINGTGYPGTATPAKQSSASTRTVVTAEKFEVAFAEDNQIQSLHGAPNAKIVSTTEGQAARISTSQDLLVDFKGNEIESILQQGDVQMQDDQRTANTEQASYVPQSDTLALTNNVRIRDKVNNTTVSSDNALINQRTGELTAKGHVKTTYLNLKPQPNGAMLG